MGFGVLAPAALGVGAVLGLAILALYLLRPKRPQRALSSTLLWVAALHEVHGQRPWRRVPPAVLLLLQLLGLAAIAIAVARPFVLSAAASGPRSVVLLDTSASMQATDVRPSRFAAARAQVASLIDSLGQDQSLGLVALGAEPQLLAAPTTDHAALQQALSLVQPGTESANLAAGLSLAGSVLQGDTAGQVIVVGDGDLDRTQVPSSLPFALRFIGVGDAAENLAIASFGTRLVDGRTTALARIANYGSQPHTVTVDLRVDGSQFDARPISVQPNALADVTWDDVPAGAHQLQAQIEQPDALALDNTAWAVLGDDRPTRVQLVSSGNVFIEKALELRPGVQLNRVSPSDYAPADPPADLVVFDGFVPAQLPGSGSLLLLHPPPGNPVVGASQDVTVSRLSAATQDDPLLTDVPLEGVHVARARRLDLPTWATLVLDSPETPLLFVGDQGGHRLGVFAFDVHQTDLPLQPAFPVLMQHLLDWLVPAGSVATPVVRTGEPVTLVPVPEAQSVAVILPDGQQVEVAPPFPPQPFISTQQPGVYQVVQRDASGAETRSAFAVNFASAQESKVLAGQSSGGAQPPNGGKGLQLAPQEVWQPVAALALVVLAIEWVAAHRA